MSTTKTPESRHLDRKFWAEMRRLSNLTDTDVARDRYVVACARSVYRTLRRTGNSPADARAKVIGPAVGWRPGREVAS